MNHFQQIIDAWLDGTITQEQIKVLNQTLLESDDLAQQFASQVQQHYILRECYANDANLATALLSPESDNKKSNDNSLQARDRATAKQKKTTTLFHHILLTATLLLVIGGTWGLTTINHSSSPSKDTPAAVPQRTPVAAIIEVDENNELQIGQAFYHRDRITFHSGSVSLRFQLGVTAEFIGPTDLEFVNEKKVILHRGQMTADVDPSAIGFTVETAHANIIDLGTKFGINVQESGDTDVVVFNGTVDVQYKHSVETQEAIARYERLTAGEAIQMKGGSRFYRIPVVQSAGDSTAWSTKIKEAESRFVSSISDNFPESSRPIYYNLVANGFDEDALSYVDRPYEWNSPPDIPFPEQLHGGDYIRMMNALKFVMNLEVKIELHRPADIYILIDKRAPPPAWLTRDFTKTDMVIGMDEYDPKGHFGGPTIDNIQTLGIGAGQSVDYLFNIWVKRNVQEKSIILGSLVEPEPTNTESNRPKSPLVTTGISMYGIVLTNPESKRLMLHNNTNMN